MIGMQPATGPEARLTGRFKVTLLPCGMQVLTACLKSFAHGE